MSELMVHEAAQNLPAAQPTITNLLATIAQAAMDPNVDVAKMHGLLDVQERMMNKQAEMDFNAALSRVQMQMPRIAKNGEIKNKSGAVVARFMIYEDIDKAIRHIYQAEGFTIVHDSEDQGNRMLVTTWLRHIGGHKIKTTQPLPYDQPNAMKSALQGAVSTFSVGKRVNICKLFDIVAEGEDDNGEKGKHVPISTECANEINALLTSTGADVPRFLDYMNIGSVEAMDGRDYDKAISAIKSAAAARQKQLSAAAPSGHYDGSY